MRSRFPWPVLLTALLAPGHAYTAQSTVPTRVTFSSVSRNHHSWNAPLAKLRPGERHPIVSSTQIHVLSKQQDEQDRFAQRRRLSLRFLYIGLTYLCFQMVLWMSLAPATWLVLRSPFHSKLTNSLIDYLEGTQNIASAALIKKFIGRPLIQMTHMVPGAVWSAIVPFQLHPTFRKNHPKTHKLLGYIFFLCSILSSVGVSIILGKGLLFENFFPDLPPVRLSNEPVVIGLSMWFSYTAARAWHAVLCRRDIEQHRTWIIRHVASGIWIALLRLFLLTVDQVLFPAPTPRTLQRSVFGNTSKVAFLVCVVVAEYAIRMIRCENRFETLR